MKLSTRLSALVKMGTGLIVLTWALAGCSGSSSSSDAGSGSGAVTGVATPSKVSVVNTN